MSHIADALFPFTFGNSVYTSHNNVLWSSEKAVFPRLALRFCLCPHPLLPPEGEGKSGAVFGTALPFKTRSLD